MIEAVACHVAAQCVVGRVHACGHARGKIVADQVRGAELIVEHVTLVDDVAGAVVRILERKVAVAAVRRQLAPVEASAHRRAFVTLRQVVDWICHYQCGRG